MTRVLRPEQIAGILSIYRRLTKQGKEHKYAVQEIAQLYDRSPGTIHTLITRLTTNTTHLAQSYLKANAFKMAVGIVRDASVQQKMDILSRPNIGVLAPMKADGERARGFFLTVSADSCGAVKVGAAMVEGQPNAIHEQETDAGGVFGSLGAGDEGEGEDVGGRDPRSEGSPGTSIETLVSRYQGHNSFQVLDADAEEARVTPDLPEFHDKNGHPHWNKTIQGREENSARLTGMRRGPGQSPAYKEAVENARKRLAARGKKV